MDFLEDFHIFPSSDFWWVNATQQNFLMDFWME